MHLAAHAATKSFRCLRASETLTHAAASADGEGAEGLPMCLSVDWSPGTGPPRLATSKSDGGLAVLELTEGKGLQLVQTWEGHEFEAWTCAFNRWAPQVVYSGGDDCAFCAWDIRTESAIPAFRNRKAHLAGITSISCSIHTEHLLATGSYDSTIRFWDVRAPHKPLESCSLPVGGGVWRLKWHPSDPCALLAACMQGGAAVVHVPQGGAGGADSNLQGRSSFASGGLGLRSLATLAQAEGPPSSGLPPDRASQPNALSTQTHAPADGLPRSGSLADEAFFETSLTLAPANGLPNSGSQADDVSQLRASQLQPFSTQTPAQADGLPSPGSDMGCSHSPELPSSNCEAANANEVAEGLPVVIQEFMALEKALVYGVDWWPAGGGELQKLNDASGGVSSYRPLKAATDSHDLVERREHPGPYCFAGCSFYEKFVEIYTLPGR